jgi:DNA-binding transcriptional MerR regulator
MYTVKQLADLAGVSVRTLHYYDEIKLLEPSSIGDNGYRYYGEDSLFRLQQILFYREMDIGLLQIKDLLDAPDFDLVTALQTHRDVLQAKVSRLSQLMATVDSTILHLVGEVELSEAHFFEGFNAETLQRYTEEAEELYGEKSVQDSVRRWKSYSVEKKQQIQAEGSANLSALAALVGTSPDSAAVQTLVAAWHQHIRYFYEPSLDTLRGLGHLYNEHDGFRATFERYHPDLPAFMRSAITVYVDGLETRRA